MVLSLLAIFAVDLLVKKSTDELLFSDSKSIPHNKVGMVLGTSKFLSNGKMNEYYTNRIKAAVSLFKAGKIDFILVSGDNSTENYDEPTTMKKDLIKAGIPSKKIFLDYAGFRTLDSVVRCKEIFGQSSYTVISQKFHNERALYIAQEKRIKAIGFNAADVNAYFGFKTLLREKLARVKVILDIWFGVDPKFSGQAIVIQ
jgi:SanA protein